MKKIISLLLLVIACSGCTVKYSFSGASISQDIKTVSLANFENLATMVSPKLTISFNDELTQKIQRETRLQVTRENGDVSFEGAIIDYRSDPLAISGDERSVQNRLTVAVRVKFTNTKEPKFSYEKTFSAFADYDSSQMLTTAEESLIPQIVEKLVQDIFNGAFSNW